MKVRIRFAKSGALVYIGHLDVMRYFQKLFRRTEMPVCYSEGFSPHQILSFSHPLPLGMESEGEYADVEMSDAINSSEAIKRLTKESVPEIKILSYKQLPERAENAMASVKAARYQVTFADNNRIDKLDEAITKLLEQKEIIVTKVTKKSVKDVDIRPLIFECFVKEDNVIEMLISSGSTDNLKPELVMNALGNMCGTTIEEGDVRIKRIDQYTIVNDKYISLDDVGTEII